MSTEIQKPSNFNVFKPSKGPLLASTAIGNVFDLSLTEKKSRNSKRTRKLVSDVPRLVAPPIDSGSILPSKGSLLLKGPRAESRMRSRLGLQSQASFYIRHNPHPYRVKHIEGLNGVPVCAVHDHDYFYLPTSSLPAPPNKNISKYFGLGQPFSYSNTYIEKVIPRIGLFPATSNWRSELQELCVKAGLILDDPLPIVKPQSPQQPPSGRKSAYSEETGRLIPPPSRATSRRSVRSSSSDVRSQSYNNIRPYPDTETLMLEMLCQILQTDSIQAVQQWLVAASDREKAMVLDMIKLAMNTEEMKILEEPQKEEIIISSPEPLSRPETAQSIQRSTKYDELNFSNLPSTGKRSSISAYSRRTLLSRNSQKKQATNPPTPEKQGTLRLRKGVLSPAKLDALATIQEISKHDEDVQ